MAKVLGYFNDDGELEAPPASAENPQIIDDTSPIVQIGERDDGTPIYDDPRETASTLESSGAALGVSGLGLADLAAQLPTALKNVVSDPVWDAMSWAMSKLGVEDEQGNRMNQDQVREALKNSVGGRLDPFRTTSEWGEYVQENYIEQWQQDLMATKGGQSYAAYLRQAQGAIEDLGDGDLKATASLLATPEAWGVFVAAAVPSLAVLMASGGSMPLIWAMEALEASNSAEDFEKETGIKIEPWQYASMIGAVGTINMALERTGFESLFKKEVGKGTGNLFLQMIKGGFVEGGTEFAQGRNTNLLTQLAYKNDITYDELMEGALPEAMGGIGAGVGIRGGRHLAAGGEVMPGSGTSPQWVTDALKRLSGREDEVGAAPTATDLKKFQEAKDAERELAWRRRMRERAAQTGTEQGQAIDIPTEGAVDKGAGAIQTPGYSTGGMIDDQGQIISLQEPTDSGTGAETFMDPKGGITHRLPPTKLDPPSDSVSNMLGTHNVWPGSPIESDQRGNIRGGIEPLAEKGPTNIDPLTGQVTDGPEIESFEILSQGLAEVESIFSGMDSVQQRNMADQEMADLSELQERVAADREARSTIDSAVGMPTDLFTAKKGPLGGDDSETRLPMAEDQGTPIDGTRPPIAENQGTPLDVTQPPNDDNRGDGSGGTPVVNLPAGATAIDVAANEAATSKTNTKPMPTPEQAKTGDYEKGHIALGNIEITWENPAGSMRSGERNGQQWNQVLQDHYGEVGIRDQDTRAGDGGRPDIFVKPGSKYNTINDNPVFFVDQVVPETGQFDEVKIMAGYETAEEAEAAYLRNYEQGWQGLGSITEATSRDLREWLTNGDTTDAYNETLRRPAGETQEGKAAEPTTTPTSPAVNKGTEAGTITKTVDKSEQARQRFERARVPNPQKDTLIQAIAKIGGLDIEEMRGQVADKQDLKRRGWGILPLFSAKGKSVQAMAEELNNLGFQGLVSSNGNPDEQALIDLLGDELQGTGAVTRTPEGNEATMEAAYEARFADENFEDAGEMQPESDYEGLETYGERVLWDLTSALQEMGGDPEPLIRMLDEGTSYEEVEAQFRQAIADRQASDRQDRGETAEETGRDAEGRRPNALGGAKSGATETVATDLFGAAPVAEQAMADAKAAKDAKLGGKGEPVAAGAVDGLFSGQTQQTDIEDALGANESDTTPVVDHETAPGDTQARPEPTPAETTDDELAADMERQLAVMWGKPIKSGTLVATEVPTVLKPLVRGIETLFNKRVVIIKQRGPTPEDFNGVLLRTNPDVIFLAEDTDAPHMHTLGHELTHTMRMQAPEVYADFEAAVMALADEGKFNKWDALFRQQLAEDGDTSMSKSHRTEEFLADVMGDNFTDSAFWDDLAARMNPGAFRQLVQLIQRVVNRLLKNWNGKGHRGTDRIISDFTLARDIAADSMARYIQNRNTGSAEMGSPSLQRAQQNTPAFKRWFGDSKVVDENGDPLVVYHGTDADIVSFDQLFLGMNTGAPSAKKGFFFSSTPRVAKFYPGYPKELIQRGMGFTGDFNEYKNNPAEYERKTSEENMVALALKAEQELRDIRKKESGEDSKLSDDQFDALSELLGRKSMFRPKGMGRDEAISTLKKTGYGDRLLSRVSELLATAQEGRDWGTIYQMQDRWWGGGDRNTGEVWGASKEGPAPNIMPVYLSIKNPFRYKRSAGEQISINDLIEKAQEEGRDGLILEGFNDPKPGVVYIVFEPTQIKSAIGNTGAYDPANPNILLQRAYHGTQNEIVGGALSTDYSGTGEGNLYGWGLTFTSSKAVADYYRGEQGGAVYEAELAPTEDQYLLWNSKFGEQSETVQEALKTIPAMGRITEQALQDMRGRHIYRHLEIWLDGGKNASQALHRAGVRGNKYPDGTTQGRDEGAFNYTLFSDDDVQVVAQLQRAHWNTPKFKRFFNGSKVVDENGNPLVVYHSTPTRGSESNNRYVRAEQGNVEYPQFSEFDTGVDGVTDSQWLGSGSYFTPDPGFANEFGDFTIPAYVALKNPFEIFDGQENNTVFNFLNSLQEMKGLPKEAKLDLSIPKNTGDRVYELAERDYIDKNGKQINWVLLSGFDDSPPGIVEGSGATKEEAIYNYRYKHDQPIWVMGAVKNIGSKEFRTLLENNGYDGVISWKRFGETPWEMSEVVAYKPTQIKSAIGNTGAYDPANPNIMLSRAQSATRPAYMDMSIEKLKKVASTFRNPHVTRLKTEEFLRLTADDVDDIRLSNPGTSNIAPWDEVNTEGFDPNEADIERPYAVPYLIVHDDGRITGHEGRHRSIMLERSGATTIPVLLERDHRAEWTKPPATLLPQKWGDGITAQGPEVAPRKVAPLKFRTVADMQRISEIVGPESEENEAMLQRKKRPSADQAEANRQRFLAGSAVQDILYHGTFADIDIFQRGTGRLGGYHGPNFYFTSTPFDASKNYARKKGPDVEMKLSEIKDRIESEGPDLNQDMVMDIFADYDMPIDLSDAEYIAENPDEIDRYIEPAFNVMPVWVSIKNPVDMTDASEQILDYEYGPSEDDIEQFLEAKIAEVREENTDEETGEVFWDDEQIELEARDRAREEAIDNGYETESGSLIGVAEAIRAAAYDYSGIEVESLIGKIFERAQDSDGISPANLESLVRASPEAMYAEDQNGNYGPGAFLADMWKEAGYDGLIYQAESHFRNMDTDDAIHYVVFEPTQIKSAIGNTGAYDSTNPDIRLQRAFHGSPHKFDKFSTDRIGTGEGAQAYGHGLYFASKRAVAEYYKKMLGQEERKFTVNDMDPDEFAGDNERVAVHLKNMASAMFFNNDSFETAQTEAINNLYRWQRKNDRELSELQADEEDLRPIFERAKSDIAEAIKVIKAIPYGSIKNKSEGTLYEVELAPSDDEYLLWDEPLSGQSEKVQEILSELGKFGPKSSMRTWQEWDSIGHRGEQLYTDLLGRWVGRTEKETSDFLHSIGIRGIKYLDGSSRGKGEGDYNYVIFDDADVSIVAALSRTAFHGSPHAGIERMSTDYIGTGEGAQAYGHGLYFAGKKAVAEFYKKALETKRRGYNTFDGRKITPSVYQELENSDDDYISAFFRSKAGMRSVGSTDVATALDEKIEQTKESISNYQKRLKSHLENPPIASTYGPKDYQKFIAQNKKALSGYKAIKKRLAHVGPSTSGALYEVELAPAEDEYLLWDEPLSGQPEKVRKAIQPKLDEIIANAENSDPAQRTMPAWLDAVKSGRLTGKQLYKMYGRGGPDRAASEALHAAGIRGIKYLDGSSRGKGEGDYNYVIFDDADVSIVAALSRTAAIPEITWPIKSTLRRGGQPVPRHAVGMTLSSPLLSITPTGRYFTQQQRNQMLTRDVAAGLQARAEAFGQIPIGTNNRSAKRAVAKAMAQEIIHQMGVDGREDGWYKSSLEKALQISVERFPSLIENPDHNYIFRTLMAVHSSRTAVYPNMMAAQHSFERFMNEGELPTDTGVGKSLEQQNKALELLKELFQEKGVQGTQKWLSEYRPIGELIAQGYGPFVEHVTERLPRSVVLGSKIGMFLANMDGNHDALTMDMWWMRTVNRLTGNMFGSDLEPAAYERIITGAQNGLLEARGFDLSKMAAGDVAEIDAWSKAVSSLAGKAGDEGRANRASMGDETRKAANGLQAAKSKLHDAPKNGTELVWMRSIARMVQSELKKQGHDLDIDDIQATIWYFEKDLWAELGIKNARSEKTDFAQAARRVVDEWRMGMDAGSGRPGRSDAGQRTESSPALQRQRGPRVQPEETYGPAGSIQAELTDLAHAAGVRRGVKPAGQWQGKNLAVYDPGDDKSENPYNLVRYHDGGGRSLLWAPGFDTEADPTVVAGTYVSPDGEESEIPMIPWTLAHKWQLVPEAYQGFDRAAAIERSIGQAQAGVTGNGSSVQYLTDTATGKLQRKYIPPQTDWYGPWDPKVFRPGEQGTAAGWGLYTDQVQAVDNTRGGPAANAETQFVARVDDYAQPDNVEPVDYVGEALARLTAGLTEEEMAQARRGRLTGDMLADAVDRVSAEIDETYGDWLDANRGAISYEAPPPYAADVQPGRAVVNANALLSLNSPVMGQGAGVPIAAAVDAAIDRGRVLVRTRNGYHLVDAEALPGQEQYQAMLEAIRAATGQAGVQFASGDWTASDAVSAMGEMSGAEAYALLAEALTDTVYPGDPASLPAPVARMVSEYLLSQGVHGNQYMVTDEDDGEITKYVVFDPDAVKFARTRKPDYIMRGKKTKGVYTKSNVDVGAPVDFSSSLPDLDTFANNIRLSKITDQTAAATIAEVAGRDDVYEAMEKGRRRVRSWGTTQEEAAKLADVANVKTDLLKSKIGTSLNAEELYMMRDELEQSALRLARLGSRLARDGSSANAIAYATQFKEHAFLQSRYSGFAAEAGRALNILRSMSGRVAELEEQMDAAFSREERLAVQKQIQGEMGSILSNMNVTTMTDLQEMGDALSQTQDPKQITKNVQEIEKSTWSDIALEIWINSLLSGPVTQSTNMVSNAAVALWLGAENYVAAGLNTITGRKGVTFRAANAYLGGLLGGMADATKTAITAFKTEEPSNQQLKLDTRRYRAISSDRLNVKPWAKRPVDVTGRLIRIPGRLLLAGDEFYKTLARRARVHQMAMEKAQAEGGTSTQIAAKYSDLVANPSLAMEQSMEDWADYATFTNRLGPLGRNIQSIANTHPYLRLIMPFIRTPVNIVKFGLGRTPFALLSPVMRADLAGKNGVEAQQLAMSRLTAGAMVASAVVLLSSMGLITGGAPDDPKERSAWYGAGNQPYSIKFNGIPVSYSRLEPLGMLFGISADFMRILNASSDAEKDAGDMAAMISSAFAANLTSKTFLRGLSEVFQMMADQERYGERWVQNFAGTLVPTFLAQTTRAIDPELKEVRSVMDKWKSRMPWTSGDLYPRRDLLGQPIRFEPPIPQSVPYSAMWSPLYARDPANANPLFSEMLRTGGIPGKPGKRVYRNRIELSPEQYDRYQIMAGQYGAHAMARLMRTREYKRMSVDAQADAIRKVFTKGRAAARSRLYREYPEIAIRILEEKRKK